MTEQWAKGLVPDLGRIARVIEVFQDIPERPDTLKDDVHFCLDMLTDIDSLTAEESQS